MDGTPPLNSVDSTMVSYIIVQIPAYYSCLFSARCEYPLVADSSVRIAGYLNPALEGTTIIFSCPPGKLLIGPDTTTCMENGEWEPNVGIGGVMCAGE